MPKTPIQIAQDGLKIALEHLKTSYQKPAEKLKNGEAPEKIIVETPFRIFEEIGYKVTEALHHLSQHATQTEDISEHFSRLERSLKETILSTTRRTYAQATATAAVNPEPNHVREIQQRNLERKVQQRREQTKLEVTLAIQGADPHTKEQLTQQPHAEITAKLQEMVESQVKENTPTIQGIQKLKSQDIRIHCNTAQEAEQLRKLKWDKAYNGLTVRRPKYGIHVPGVPTDMINPNEIQNPELTRELERQNKENGLEILEMKPMRRKLKENARHFSLVVFCSSSEMADKCIKHGIYINHQRFFPEKYTPQFQLIQCYKCQQFGHHATKCRSLHEICGKCSEHHLTSQCNSERHKCTGCKGEHPAWHHDCPNRISAIQNITTRKREASTYFNE